MSDANSDFFLLELVTIWPGSMDVSNFFRKARTEIVVPKTWVTQYLIIFHGKKKLKLIGQ